MVDYVTLMLINMTAAFALLGCYVWQGLDTEYRQNWAPVFAICGFVAAVCGFVMIFTWPLPQPYNIAFGEMSVLFGILLLGTALTLGKGWELMPLAIFGVFAGAAALLIGTRIIELGLTKNPILSGIGFILSGSAGIFAPIVVWQEEQKGLRVVTALALFAISGIWAWIGYLAYWSHMVVAK